VETTTQDPDQRVEEARASLLARVEELGKRLKEAKAKLDIPAKIAEHPRLAVGIAFAAGALLAFPRKGGSKSEAKAEAKGGLMGAAMATLGSLVFGLAKNMAMHKLSTTANTWWDKRSAMEDEASKQRDVEVFLEH